MDCQGLSRIVKDCQGLSRTVMDCHGLSWTVMDCHRLYFTYWLATDGRTDRQTYIGTC